MASASDTRAQSIQIGAVLLFAVLIIMLSIWQAAVVPNQNEEIEFNHNEQLQEQMTELRSAVISMPGSSTPQAVAMDLGVRYPSRAIFVNPGPASGNLRTNGTTDDTTEIVVENVQAAGETGDFWNAADQKRYNTGAIEYRPGYNNYVDSPRTVYEHSVVYNRFDRQGTTLPVTEQSVIDGDKISLVVINGSLQKSRVGTASVDVEPISTNSRTVELEVQDATTPAVHLPTELDPTDWWRDGGDAGLLANEDNVTDVQESGEVDGIEIYLAEGTYDLQMAKVGVGTGATQTSEAYLTNVSGGGSTLAKGETQELTVEVRDKFNNPKKGVAVRGSAAGGSFAGSDEKETDSEGQATFRYDASNTGTNAVNFTILDGYQPVAGDPHDASSTENVTMDVTVETASSASDSAFSTFWQNPSGQGGLSCTWSEKSCTLDASSSREVDLTTETDPTADSVKVFYDQNDSSKGSFSPAEGTTDSNGEDTTTFEVGDNGGVKLYTSSRSSGDAFDLKIENLPSEFGLLVFRGYNGNDKRLASVELSTGTVRTYGELKPQALAGSADLDGDGTREIPYVPSGAKSIDVVDAGGDGSNNEILYNRDDYPDKIKPATDTRMATGDLDGDGNLAVFFVGQDDNSVWKYEDGDEELSTVINADDSDTEGAAVAGVADVSGANGPDLVFVDSDGDIRYYNPDTGTIGNTGVGLNTDKALGEPADFSDGDGDTEIPYNKDGEEIRLADKEGFDETIVSVPNLPEQPLGTANADSSTKGKDVVFLDENGYIKYAAVDGTTGFVLDNNGDQIQVTKPSYGVVAGKEP